MKKTTRIILAKLALVALVVGGRTAHAQEGPNSAAPPFHARTLIAAQQPTITAIPDATMGIDAQPEQVFAATDSAEMVPESAFVDVEGPLPQQSVSLDGGTWAEDPLGPCCAICGGGSDCPPGWYTHQEVRLLSRSGVRVFPLTFEGIFIGSDALGNPVFTPNAVMTTRTPAFDVSAGYSTTIGRYLGRDSENRDRFFEFSYWGLNNWRESRSVTGERLTDTVTFPGNVVTFGGLNSGFQQVAGTPTPTFNSRETHSASLLVGGFNRTDQQSVFYQSNVHNFEFNLRFRPRGGPDRLVLHPNGRWRRECPPERQLSYLFGVRVMSTKERFNWRTQGAFEVNGAPFSTVSAEYLVRTYNDLVGIQFGADLMYRRCKYSWGLRAKAGPYINFASQVSNVDTDAADDPYAATLLDYRRSASKDDAAFIGECGVVGTYKFRPNLVLRASYDVMWVVGVAMAPDQVSFQTDPPRKINTNATGFYQGLSLGFEWLR